MTTRRMSPPTMLLCDLSPEVVVGLIQPVLPDRTEDVERKGVVERLGLMLDPRGNMQHLAFAHGDLLAADEELERALQDVGHLLALVRVHRNDAAGLQIDLRQHLALARHDLPREHLGDFFEGDFVPAMESDDRSGHGSASIYHPRASIEPRVNRAVASQSSFRECYNLADK